MAEIQDIPSGITRGRRRITVKSDEENQSIGSMESSQNTTDWSLCLKGASGSSPTEYFVEVGKDTGGNNGLRLTNAFFRPTASTSKGIEGIVI